MLGPLKIFGDWTRAGSQLGFYTKFTSAQIPAVEGCYAWFLPLWIYEKDLNQLLDVINRVIRYEPEPEPTTSAPFNWESIQLKVRRDTSSKITDAKRELWDRLLEDPNRRQALERVLLQTSVLMPPLYVGRTSNLQRRYVEHVEGRSEECNDFHGRFSACVEKAGLPLSVGDLLFVCVKTTPDSYESEVTVEDLDSLLEHVLMQICRPPFSLK